MKIQKIHLVEDLNLQPNHKHNNYQNNFKQIKRKKENIKKLII